MKDRFLLSYDLIALLLLARISVPSYISYKKKGFSFFEVFLPSIVDRAFFKKFLNLFLLQNVSKYFILTGKSFSKVGDHQVFVSAISLKHFFL
ncbi:hypothetical protein K6U55_15030 [Vibrio diabolicus]|uniref:hypothetical protein n=1 Tax=Vibrio diabolicus TaxID=50719 RepID=UPI00211B64EB|nr:hypothetical protein [Vibrio diabolicus]MCG6243336.1 hypothetical protein [Vibrio diabolicus]